MSDVSLIIPCYNHATALERAVVSGLAQDGLCEIVVVDDCSTDNSLCVAKQLAERDPRIHVVRMDRNSGPGAARNLGVRCAHGSYVSFLDADDELIEPDFFMAALNAMATQPGMVVIKSDMEFFDPVKGYLLPAFDPRYQSAVLSSSCAMLIARDAFFLVGGFPELDVFRGSLGGEDVAFMQAVMEHLQPLGRLPSVCYRVWSQSGSHIDKFLASTRLTATGFEFVDQSPERVAMASEAEKAVSRYVDGVRQRVRQETEVSNDE